MTGRHRVDLNADMGEGDGDADAALLAIVSSCSIACGGHAGDAGSMARTVRLAGARGVAIGAHPSYPDRAGFGRRPIAIAPARLTAALEAQIGALATIAAAAGVRLAHVKPHGALYAAAATDRRVADAVVAAVRAIDPQLVVVGLSGGELLRAGTDGGLAVASEVFADRGYGADGTLTPRGFPGAVLHDPAAVAARALRMVTAGIVAAADGAALPVRADTICIHGDTPNAAALAGAVRAALDAAGVTVAPFSSAR